MARQWYEVSVWKEDRKKRVFVYVHAKNPDNARMRYGHTRVEGKIELIRELDEPQVDVLRTVSINSGVVYKKIKKGHLVLNESVRL
jgi:2,3-bisphosphoglycerate-independent phosphoglycerate mutase